MQIKEQVLDQLKQVSSQKQPSLWRRITIVSVAIFVIVITVGVSGYALGVRRDYHAVPSLSPHTPHVPLPSTPVVSSYTQTLPNWRIFTSRASGYSIEYPAFLTYSHLSYPAQNGRERINVDRWLSRENGISISIDSVNEDVNPELEFGMYFAAVPHEEGLIVLNGKDTKKIISQDGMEVTIGPVNHRGRNYILVSLFFMSSRVSTVFDQMISTFKFLELDTKAQ